MMTIEEKAKAYDKGVETVAAILNAMAEHKPNIELIQRSWYMEGYHDREFGKEPKWIIKTGEGGPKHELNPRYGQPLADEQKPVEVKQNPLIRMMEDKKAITEDIRNGIPTKTIEKERNVKFATPVDVSHTEWSDEDERMLSRCIKSVECSKQFADSESYKAAKDVEMNWLKSLRPSWKPSEMQMDYLSGAYASAVAENDEKAIKVLGSLYDDLLKLKQS